MIIEVPYWIILHRRLSLAKTTKKKANVGIQLYDHKLTDGQIKRLAALRNMTNEGSKKTTWTEKVHACREWRFEMEGKNIELDDVLDIEILKEQSRHRGKNCGTNWTNLMGGKLRSRMYANKSTLFLFHFASSRPRYAQIFTIMGIHFSNFLVFVFFGETERFSYKYSIF